MVFGNSVIVVKLNRTNKLLSKVKTLNIKSIFRKGRVH